MSSKFLQFYRNCGTYLICQDEQLKHVALFVKIKLQLMVFYNSKFANNNKPTFSPKLATLTAIRQQLHLHQTCCPVTHSSSCFINLVDLIFLCLFHAYFQEITQIRFQNAFKNINNFGNRVAKMANV